MIIMLHSLLCILLNTVSDIDECAEGVEDCAQVCTDTVLSYICSCHSGYRLASDGRGCTEINECAEGTDGCTHTCTNTAGSYTCSCNSGYRLASNRRTCNGNNYVLYSISSVL